jgi:hypothetical protein
VTKTELKAKAASRYAGALKKALLGENPFPLAIPYKRPSRSGDPGKLIGLKNFLRGESKAENGFGPTVQFEEARTRRFGGGVLAGSIVFDTLDDLTRYIEKKGEAGRILAHAAIVTAVFPEARAWTASQLKRLAEYDAAKWQSIVHAVLHFRAHPKPWVYPREVPLGLSTKFLEQNYAVIIDLLFEVAPDTLNAIYTSWQDRLGLRSASEMIEGRFLDGKLAPYLPQHMLAPVKEWNRCAFDAPTWVLITENRTTLLTLPPLQGCLALLGKGYAASRLAQIEKLGAARVYYWGDIDQHGFEILASLRHCLPGTQSCLMDDKTLLHCAAEARKESVASTLPAAFVADNLTSAERVTWQKCAATHLRLEQENIPAVVSSAALIRLSEDFRSA